MLGLVMLAVVFAGITAASFYERRQARRRAIARAFSTVRSDYDEFTRQIGEALVPVFLHFGTVAAEASAALERLGLTIAFDTSPLLSTESNDPQRRI